MATFGISIVVSPKEPLSVKYKHSENEINHVEEKKRNTKFSRANN